MTRKSVVLAVGDCDSNSITENWKLEEWRTEKIRADKV